MAIEPRTERYDVGGVLLERPFKVRRLGHFGLDVERMDECLRFYHDLLGFRLSDVLDFGKNPRLADALKGVSLTKGYFTHYGGDHHAFVLFPRPMRKAMAASRGHAYGPNINQLTWQVGSLREVVEAVGYFDRHGVTIERSGRDMPGSNWHTYIQDPDRHTNELYYGIEQIGWQGVSKPLPFYAGRAAEPPALPVAGEEAEVDTALGEGVDLRSGHRDTARLPAVHDVEGVLLERPFKVTRIGPVHLFVTDVDASARFYTQRMGFTVTTETTVEGQRCVFLRAGAEHHSLGLLPLGLRERLGVPAATTLAAFGVSVGSYRQLRESVAFLREQGVSVIDVPAGLHPGMDHAAYAVDPEGHRVLLHTYLEQVGWAGAPREQGHRHVPITEWPEAIEPLSDVYADQTFQGPLG
jgi:catechol 2,3-dioxygenase-like lactoylglutathione lyase family enzyme